MRPEDDAEKWKERVLSRVFVKGVSDEEAVRLASLFSRIYVESGGRRLPEDYPPVSDVEFHPSANFMTLQSEGTRMARDCKTVDEREKAIVSLAKDAARESAEWW